MCKYTDLILGNQAYKSGDEFSCSQAQSIVSTKSDRPTRTRMHQVLGKMVSDGYLVKAGSRYQRTNQGREILTRKWCNPPLENHTPKYF